MDLRQRKLDRESIDSDTVTKHKKDIFRLLTVAETVPQIALRGDMKRDIDQFVAIMREEPLILKDIGITQFSMDDLLNNLSLMYL